MTESDELFTLLNEFAESFKALLPKPKPTLKARGTAASLLGGADRGRGSLESVADGAELDPMLSRIHGVYTADRGTRPEPSNRGSVEEPSAEPRKRSSIGTERSRVPSISDLARARAPSITDKARASVVRSDSKDAPETLTPKKDSAAVDLKLQQRLAARFERAKAKHK